MIIPVIFLTAGDFLNSHVVWGPGKGLRSLPCCRFLFCEAPACLFCFEEPQLLVKANTPAFTAPWPERKLPQGGNMWHSVVQHNTTSTSTSNISTLDSTGRWMAHSDHSQVLRDNPWAGRALCLTCQWTWICGQRTSQMLPSASPLS